MIALACFVVPISGAITYAIGGSGALIARLVACFVILMGIWFGAHRLERQRRRIADSRADAR